VTKSRNIQGRVKKLCLFHCGCNDFSLKAQMNRSISLVLLSWQKSLLRIPPHSDHPFRYKLTTDSAGM